MVGNVSQIVSTISRLALGITSVSPLISTSATRTMVSDSICWSSDGKETTVPISPKYGALITRTRLPGLIPEVVSLSDLASLESSAV